MWSDLRFGLRLLVRNPGITAAVVVSLALGLGATTAMFSLLNSLMFKSLPVPEPGRLVVLNHGAGADLDSSFTYPQLTALHESAAPAVDLFGYAGGSDRIAIGNTDRTVQTQFVSGDYFRVLRVQPATGRLLLPADDLRGSPSATTAVISYRLWQSAFHADPAIAGRTVRIDSVPFVIAGVTPPSFFGVETGAYPDITMPFAARLALNPKSTMLDCKGCYWLSIMGRLAPGVTPASAEAGLKVIWKNVRLATMPDVPQRYQAEYFAERLALVPGATGISFLRTRFSQPLYVLLAITALILLLSCSNVANLLMARAQARRRELAIRVAIGAARGRLVRQLLTESALLATAGLLAGIVVYQFCVTGLVRFLNSGGQEVYLDTAPDLRLLAFAGGAALLTLALFGLIPSLRATARPSSHSVTARSSFTRVVLCGQIALSFTLLVGATLLARSLYDLRTFPAGFRRDHLLMLSPDNSGRALPDNAARIRYTRTLLDQVRALPGVRSASASVVIPMGGSSWQFDYAAGAVSGHAYVNLVMPDFFRTMGTRLIMGRDLTAKDDAASPRIAVVNESFARRYWPGQSPLGKQFHEVDKAAILITVAGVVEDARYRDFRKNAPPTVYLPLLQRDSTQGWSLNLEVWTYTDPQSLIRPMTKLLGGVETTIRTFTELIDRRLLYERLLTSLSLAFGALGILICAVGIYGVAAYSVSRRTAEIGIRMALGATPGHVMRRILREQAALLGAGLIAGAAGAVLLTRFLRAWLFGVSPTDLPTLLAGMICLAIVTGIATSVPARRAAAIEPLRALRHDS